MDPTTTTTATPTATSTPPTGFLPFANGSSGKPPQFHSLAQSAQLQVSYKECLRNHAAAIGGHAVDGCCEYMPSSSSSGPTSLKCAACGCHRNFHRRDPDDPLPIQQHHAPSAPLLPPPPPPPPSSSLYSSALLALGIRDNSDRASGKKRGKRTRFSIEQKERMREFAERIGWRIRRADGDEIDEFCEEVGVGKGALKVWMHNHKHGYKLRRSSSNGIVDDNDENDEGNRDDEGGDHEVGVNCRDR